MKRSTDRIRNTALTALLAAGTAALIGFGTLTGNTATLGDDRWGVTAPSPSPTATTQDTAQDIALPAGQQAGAPVAGALLDPALAPVGDGSGHTVLPADDRWG
ncbi:hypothetical protein [Kitasatospora sp. NPDC057198]|uniref:hypothetical protein n=1 Tax=Kitasatospora sp. NPDC057198 TaxID=3346046 RepID=UPI00363467A0